MKSTFLLYFLLLSFGACHAMQSAAESNLQSAQLGNSTLLNTYEGGYKAYLNESEDTNIDTVIRQGLLAYNILKDGEDVYDHCTVTITSELGEVIAGATSDICKNEHIIDTCLLHTVWVHEDHRHRGLGTKVMHQLTQYVKSKGCKIIQVEAHEYQDHAKDFFEKLGFQTVATVPNPETLTGFEIYIMRKSLNDNDSFAANAPIDNAHDYRAHIETSWSETKSQTIADNLDAYYVSHAHIITDDPYTIFLVSDTGEIIAGAIGHIHKHDSGNTSNTVHIFWVDEKHRNHKLGTKLMLEVIRYAQNKGCQFIQLDTFEWQARGFYEKLGFTVVATIPNIENCHGGEHYYMRMLR